MPIEDLLTPLHPTVPAWLSLLRSLYLSSAHEKPIRRLLETLKEVLPGERHSWMRIDAKRRLAMEVVTRENQPLEADHVREACGQFAAEHPGMARIYANPGQQVVVRMSEQPDQHEKWLGSEYHRLMHAASGVQDELVASFQVRGEIFAILISRATPFSAAEASFLRTLLPDLAAAHSMAWQFHSDPAPLSTPDTLTVHYHGDFRKIAWPAEVVAVLQDHSSEPVLTFRFPLPEDFIRWLYSVTAAIREGLAGANLRVYTADNGVSCVKARFIPDAHRSSAMIGLELRPTAAHLAKRLSPRECEVAYWVAQGKRNEEVGEILRCKTATVAKHIQNTLQKLGVENRAGIAAAVLEGKRTHRGKPLLE